MSRLWDQDVEPDIEPCPVPFCIGRGVPAEVPFHLATGERGFKCQWCSTPFFVYRTSWDREAS